jgi:hypothetical protein
MTKEVVQKSPKIPENNTDSIEISGFFATKIFELLEDSENNQNKIKLKEYLKKFFNRIIQI